ncbi:hypothetical protein SAMN05216227_103614 [Pseudorhodobacter antarcticus]|uniref:Uncharacterized protein n=1 Tax=Pseudorhodobacter antarcticus TaxID=1077947 RepID=A0A1H8KXD0_9RHOB|nr:hypothetical protein [Pseudorhodobacter antarcticus]SEN97481.1 hypothetical protein SAMN05216227_103614 [Pseudorhodobacter antarcticus]
MKLLNYTYMKLIEIEEIETAEELSKDWCSKNRNWFAWQKHAGQDFSLDAAINCLARTRQRLAEREDTAGKRGLEELEQLLSDYLLRKHKVAEIDAFRALDMPEHRLDITQI